jgi:hypothetical protein
VKEAIVMFFTQFGREKNVICNTILTFVSSSSPRVKQILAHFWIRDVNGEACAPSHEEMLGNDIQEGIGFINGKFPLLYNEISFANQLSKVKISSIFNLTWIFQKPPLHYKRRLIQKYLEHKLPPIMH